MRHNSLRATFAAAAFAVAIVTLTGSSASAHEPACAGYKGVANHGEHVITDYVLGAVVGGEELESWPPSGGIGDVVGDQGGAALPGGPGPAYHFEVGAPPGASFCVP
ncbi:MAG TPA: hypothetical protein VFZ64_01945 [Nocardioidaceae bacterium]